MKLPWILKNLKLPRPRNFTQRLSDGDKNTWKYELRKWAFNWSGFNKYGLYLHDVIDHDHPVVREALRRLPEDVVDARNFRLIRAMQLSFLKIYLPKEKWITYEQDLEYRYLEPYIYEINAEWKEMFEFDGTNWWNREPVNEVK